MFEKLAKIYMQASLDAAKFPNDNSAKVDILRDAAKEADVEMNRLVKSLGGDPLYIDTYHSLELAFQYKV